MSHTPLVLILLAALLLGACATTKNTGEVIGSAKSLYLAGKKDLDAGYYDSAIEQFESLEARYPFGKYAQQAQLDMAYAYYKSDQPESAIAAADRFIKTFPRHPHVDYAYYLRGLADFDLTSSLYSRMLHDDPARRDPRSARESFRYFATLLEQFPDSLYAQDARLRMIFLRNYLARHEIHVARFYMRRGAYVAVLNRSKNVLITYYQTPSVPEALWLMIRAYRKLGLKAQATETQQVLKLNYPHFQAPRKNS